MSDGSEPQVNFSDEDVLPELKAFTERIATQAATAAMSVAGPVIKKQHEDIAALRSKIARARERLTKARECAVKKDNCYDGYGPLITGTSDTLKILEEGE